MAKARSLVGLDVHAAKIVAAVLDADTGELEVLVMSGDNGGAAAFCAGLPRPVRVAYEAGLTGYPLARELAKRGVECVVVAPSKIPRATGDKVKNDRRDAEHLVRLLLAGKLHPVRVPGPEEEALRDLVRARETLRLDLMRARHRLLKMLMRHGVAFDDGHAWTQRHRAWLKTVVLEWPAAQTTLLDLEGVIDVLVHRREHLEREIVANVPGSPWETQVGRLRCLRGIDTLTAVGKTLTDRQAGQPPAAVAVAWTAQRRLYRTWTRMEARSKRRTLIAVAAARELVGFCWAISPRSNRRRTLTSRSAGSVAARDARGTRDLPMSSPFRGSRSIS